MEHQDILMTFAEVAVAFAGFSAVVSVFDRRAEEDDPRIRHYRVRVMVEYSLCVVVFAFLPYLLNALIGSEEWAWRGASGALTVVWSFIGLSAGRRAAIILGRPAHHVAPAFSGVATALGFVGAAILLANLVGLARESAGTLYLVGLFFPLLQSALYFLRIVAHGDPIADPGDE